MGRKIPAKKHRGVKDPLLQQAKRQQSLQGKINAPPKDPDDQPVPKSLERLFAFQNKNKAPAKVRPQKKRQPHKDSGGGGGGRGAVSGLRRLPGETPRAFSLRINSAVRALHRRPEDGAEDEEDEEDVKGERIAWQRERRARKRRGQRAGERSDERAGEGEQQTRAQRRANKLKEKKNAAQERLSAARAAAPQYERVRFGEQAHAPPALAPPAYKHLQGVQRAGRRGLLLESRERARLQAVAVYRALKAAQQHRANNKNK